MREGITPSLQFSYKYEIHITIYVIMTYRFHVHDVFDEMYIMVRVGQVNFLIKCWIKGFFIVSFIVIESFIKFWVVIWRLALKTCLRPHGHRVRSGLKRLQSLPCKLMHVTRCLQSNLYSVVLVFGIPRYWKRGLTQGLDTWKGGLTLGGPVAPEGS